MKNIDRELMREMKRFMFYVIKNAIFAGYYNEAFRMYRFIDPLLMIKLTPLWLSALITDIFCLVYYCICMVCIRFSKSEELRKNITSIYNKNIGDIESLRNSYMEDSKKMISKLNEVFPHLK